MNNSLDKFNTIQAEKLDPANYFQALLEQAQTIGLLSDSDIERLQYESLCLLACQTERYNGGDSSSLPLEKAQDIMTSILFTIGLWLKTLPNPDDAVTILQNNPLKELYQKGRQRIDTMLKSAKIVHAKLLSGLVQTYNVFYRSTIDSGIKGFFKLYDPDFSAHEIHITADYPTFHPRPRLQGVEFIQAYLNDLYFENLFCAFFEADDIHHLLSGYAEDYREHLMNIFEPVLITALGCTIVGTDVRHLDITAQGTDHLYRSFTEMPKKEIAPVMQNAMRELINILRCSDGVCRYIQSCLPLLVTVIQNGIQAQTLSHIFVLPSFPENNTKIVFSYGDKIDDGQYRKILAEIDQCRYSSDKLAIIKEHIHSLADLEDILLDASLSGDEARSVLIMLGLPEISALSKRYKPFSDMDTFDLREQESLMRKRLRDFIFTLPKNQQDIIINASAAIDED